MHGNCPSQSQHSHHASLANAQPLPRCGHCSRVIELRILMLSTVTACSFSAVNWHRLLHARGMGPNEDTSFTPLFTSQLLHKNYNKECLIVATEIAQSCCEPSSFFLHGCPCTMMGDAAAEMLVQKRKCHCDCQKQLYTQDIKKKGGSNSTDCCCSQFVLHIGCLPQSF